MNQAETEREAEKIALAIDADMRAQAVQNTPSLRGVRRKYSQVLKQAAPELVLQVAEKLCGMDDYRWVAYELIEAHRGAFASLDAEKIEALGQGIDSWWRVDSFGRSLSGLAWRSGLIPDGLILKWAGSSDRWWRRAALVSTVALNVRSHGGWGDVPRTLRICRILAGDQDEMVAKGLSWALRELVVHDAKAVEEFLDQQEQVLPALVKREVRNKLMTGLKNPGRKTSRGRKQNDRQ
jgi:3-methyladenine DNA glycosylase AlkD